MSARLATAILCDSATVREGLLHILGGGITRLWRDQLPAALGFTLALMIEVSSDALRVPHEVHVRIVDDDGANVAEAMGGFQVGQPAVWMETTESQLVPLVVPLHTAVVTHFGGYTVQITIDDEAASPLRFLVLHPDEQQIPPL